MKAFRFLSKTAFVFSLVLLASCSSDNDIEETQTVAKKIEFKAVINSNDTEASSKVTRATLEDDYTVSWDERDAISVYCDNKDQSVEFGITPSSIDGTTATFTNYGEVLPFWFEPESYYYALYPGSSATFDTKTSMITSVMPTNQTVSAGRTYDKKTLFMAACADKDERIFNFKNIPALVKVTVSNNAAGKVQYIEIVAKNTADILTGNFEVSPNYDRKPFGFRAVSSAAKKHTVKLRIPASEESQDFYLAVLPGRIDGLTLQFEDKDSKVLASHESKKSVEFKSSKIYPFGSYDIEKETPAVK
jgi:hypothetical protein